MKFLGIDFGLRKIGLALSEGLFPKPLKVIRVNSPEKSINEIKDIVNLEKIDKIIIGVSEGVIGEESKKFAELLKISTGLDVFTIDETFSTQNANSQLIFSGKQRKKRKQTEDAIAAALILENYFKNH
jgi:putative holliday junction resolvase